MKPEDVIRFGDIVFSEAEKKAIMEVCDSNRVTEHKKTAEFERKWADKIGTAFAVTVNSGTSGLILGFTALKHLANDPRRRKVITTPLTFVATGNALEITGLEPVFADVDKQTFAILPEKIEEILKNNDPSEFLAIAPVHLMGYACDMDEINRIAKKYGLYVFEDAAEAHGTRYKGRVVGSLGDLSNYSFYIAHNIQVGEFGAVNTNSLQIRNLLRKLKTNGRVCVCDVCVRMDGKCPELKKAEAKADVAEDFDPRYTHDMVGFNFKTNEFMSALAIERLKSMDEINRQRRANVMYLNEGLKKHSDILQIPLYSEDVSYLAYPLVVKKGSRKLIRQELEKRGIETRPLFGSIPHHQPSFSKYKEAYGDKLPNALWLGNNGFFIGCHQGLGKEQLDRIIATFDDILKDK